jgi:hypothetical protein
MGRLVTVAFLILGATAALADGPPSSSGAAPVPAGSQKEWAFAGVPIGVFNSDEGVGGGGVVGLYHYAVGYRLPGTSPDLPEGTRQVRDDISLRLYLTSRLVQRHELRWDGREAFGLPLRIWARVALFSTVTQNYCGLGGDTTCSPALAISAADARGLSPTSTFERHFYEMRYIRPSADTLWRLRVRDFPAKTEIMAGWRLGWYVPGDFFHRGPYPGSFYAEQFPQGEPGISSLWQLGFTIDNRDFEPNPSRGFFFESSVRACDSWWGCHWKYAGVNAELTSYLPIYTIEPRLVVLANRSIVDVENGDVPTEEIAETGGTRDDAAFGGQWIGRGIRDRRYIGKVKVIDQVEARTHFFDVNMWNMKLDVGGAVFTDLGYIAADIPSIAVEHPNILWGVGCGLRFVFQDAINWHVDVAVSPDEPQQPSFYTPASVPW